MEELIRIAFEAGCSVDYGAIQPKIRADETVRQRRYLSDKVVRRAVDNGYWLSLQQIRRGSRAGLSQFSKPGIDEGHFYTEAALHQLGMALVKKAQSVMPKNIMALADQWQSSTPDQQAKLCRNAGHLMSRAFRAGGALRTQEFIYHIMEHALSPYPIQEVFPSQWKKGDVRPNCLGMAIMLMAFLKRAGATFRMVTVTELHEIEQQRMKSRMYGQMAENFRDRGIANDEILQKLDRHVHLGKLFDTGAFAFHHAAMVEVGGRWILLDPYMQSYYVLQNRKQVEKAERLFSLYGSALPGLALPIVSSNPYPQLIAKNAEGMDEAIRHSVAMGKLVEGFNGGLEGLYCKIRGTEPYNYLMDLYPRERGLFGSFLVPADMVGEFDRESLAFLYALLPFKPDPILDLPLLERGSFDRFSSEPAFREECLHRLQRAFLYWKSEELSAADKDLPQLHRSLEVYADPFHALAMFVINAVNCSLERGGFLPQAVCSHTSSQFIWRDTSEREGDGRVSQQFHVAAAVLSGLPRLHPAVRDRLANRPVTN